MLTHKEYLKIAVPFIISTVTQPLLGAVDTAVIGQLGSAYLIGGVAVGTVVMNTLYWLFGFLRVSTTGYSAIALGSGKPEEKAASLIRPFFLAGLVGGLFIVFQPLIWLGTSALINPEPRVAEQAHTYFSVLIWGAPFVLANYTMIGWLMGQAKIKATLFAQIFGNVLNIVLDFVFVLYFDFGVAGVAWASLIAQGVTFGIGLFLIRQCKDVEFSKYLRQVWMGKQAVLDMFSSNADLLLRTVCLLTVFNGMARVGSSLGADTLASNAILMQATFMVSYIFDGIANASSVFSGKAVGQKNPVLLRETVQKTSLWTGFLILFFTLLLFLFIDGIAAIFTDIPQVLSEIENNRTGVIFFPLAAGYGLTFYGIFTGSGTTRPVRNSTICAALVFLVTVLIAVEPLKNDGLWLAFLLFYVGRTLFLVPFLKDVHKKCS